MKKLTTLLLLMLGCIGGIQAQVPGYMGKRLLLLIDANPSPALFNMNVNHKVTMSIGDDSRAMGANLFAMNVRPQIGVEYLLAKNFALGVNYQAIRTGTVKQVPYEEMHSRFDIMRGDAVGLNLKFYRHNVMKTIAPIGAYTSLSASMTRINTYNEKGDKQKQFQNDLLYPTVNIGWGKQFMPFPNFIVGTGMELGWAFVPLNMAIDSDLMEDEEASISHAQSSLLGYYLFNFKLSVGYMLF